MADELERYQLGDPIDTGRRWMCQADDALVEDRFHLGRVVGRVEKDAHNSLLTNTRGLPTVLFAGRDTSILSRSILCVGT